MFNKNEKYNYFNSFIKFSGYAAEAAETVLQTVKNFEPDLFEQNRTAVHKIENSADELKHEVTEILAAEFIPPIEREDIVTLLSELDNVVDAIDEITGYLYMYNVTTMRRDALPLAELTVKSTKALGDIFSQFANFRRSKTIGQSIVTVNELETEGDAAYASAVRRLFADEANAVNVIIWKDIFGRFENCLDCCEHVADIVESVIMKNS